MLGGSLSTFCVPRSILGCLSTLRTGLDVTVSVVSVGTDAGILGCFFVSVPICGCRTVDLLS